MSELTLELRTAAERDDAEAIDALIEAGVDPNAKNLAWRRWHGREPTTEFDERLRAAFSVTDSRIPVK